MDKQSFIRNYMCTFLASYSASQYDWAFFNGTPINIKQPVEHAAQLAELAWSEIEARL